MFAIFTDVFTKKTKVKKLNRKNKPHTPPPPPLARKKKNAKEATYPVTRGRWFACILTQLNAQNSCNSLPVTKADWTNRKNHFT